jgi:hypothetical protein
MRIIFSLMSLDMIKGLKRKGEIEFVNEKSKDFSG